MTLLHDDIQISIVKTNEEIQSLADVRYQEWTSDHSKPPTLTSFRLATADIFCETAGQGSLAFLASILNNDGIGFHETGKEKHVAVGAAELSPIELTGVFTENDIESVRYENAQNGAMSLYITDVVTSLAHRRCGIGSKLMNAVERHAWKKGAKMVFLHVEPTNFGSRQFYKVLGYIDVNVESVEGRDDIEKNGFASFSLADGRLITPLQTKTLKNAKEILTMDTKRLADNAGARGQLLMMKNLALSLSSTTQ